MTVWPTKQDEIHKTLVPRRLHKHCI